MVERGGLENRCTRERTVGSNPTPSANHKSLIIQCKLTVRMGFELPVLSGGYESCRPGPCLGESRLARRRRR